jgi:hypothetical protein
MEKVDEKWLKKNGWTCWHDEVTERWEYSTKIITHHTVYVKSVGDINKKDYKRARWEHTYKRCYLVSKKTGNEYFQGTSNFYMFSAFGDMFKVENNISHRKFEAEKIEAACTLCGIK